MPFPRKNNPSYQYMVRFWSKYCELEDIHLQWLKKHADIRSNLKRGQVLHFDGDPQKIVFIVTKGLVGRVTESEKTGKRKIISVGIPGMALMTTKHLYSSSPSIGSLIVLRSGTEIVSFKYRSILEFRIIERNTDILIGVFTNKKKEQLNAFRRIALEESAFDKCLLFTKEFPLFFQILSHQEIADILSISKRTVQAVSSYLARHPDQ